MLGISLFSSGGIGDLAAEACGVKIMVANELLEERTTIYKRNFPHAEVLTGDIWELQDEIVDVTLQQLNGEELDFILATPPCQGMSKNGQGKLLQGIREGKKPAIDQRNKLIIPALNVIKKLRPKIVVFENVPEMKDTIIDDENGRYIKIVDYIAESLGSDYIGGAEVVEFADYGVPQSRKRLITIFSRLDSLKSYYLEHGTFIPPQTHSQKGGDGLKRRTTIRDVLADLPPLDGKDEKSATSSIPYHFVPVLDPKKYVWILNTPPECGAFDNQCINPDCCFQENPTHGSTNETGINKAKTDTPLYCLKCGSLLPRPYTEKNGEKKLMSGFTSAYRRMDWDKPSPTLNTNFSYPSCDKKLHPDQHRVLSIYEAMRVHTLDQYDYKWEKGDGREASDTVIRDIIGESIPPKGLEYIIAHVLRIASVKPMKVVKSDLLCSVR